MSSENVTTEVSPPPTDEEKRIDAMAQIAKKRGVAIKQTRGNGKAPDSEEKPSFIPPAHPAAILIDSVVNNPDFDFVAGQITPVFKRDIPIPKMKVADMRGYLENELGGGVFVIQVRHNGTDVEDEKHGVLKLTVPVKVLPKVENKEADAVLELAARRKEIAEKRRLEAEAAELEAERDERHKKKNANPELERQLAEARQKNERLEEQQRQAQLAALSAPKESAVDQLVKLAPLIAALAPLFKREPDTSMAEAVKENGRVMERVATSLQQAQEKTMQAMKEMNSEQMSILKEASKKEDPIVALQRVLALKKELLPDPEDGMGFNPKYGWNNAWLLAGEIMDGIKEGLAPVMNLVAERWSKPPQQATEAEILKMAKEIVDRKRAALGTAPKKAALPMTSNPPQQQPAPEPFVPEVIPEETAPVEANNSAPHTPPEAEMTTPPQAAVVTPAEQKIRDEVECRVKIEESISDILDDINLGRTAEGKHLWIDNALRTWPREFLNELVDLTPKQIQNKIRSKLPEQAWGPIFTALMNAASEADRKETGRGQYVYNNYEGSFGLLAMQWKEMRSTAE